MHDIDSFGRVVLAWGLVGAAALLAQQLARRMRLPAAALVLVAAAVSATYVKAVREAVTLHTVENVVTLALIAILFDGGLHLGRRRFRESAAPIVVLGVLGTFATAALIAVLAHLAFALSWKFSLVLGAALAPTDPAVVFALLANHENGGRTSSILQGESGFNDPAGIALLLGFVQLATHPQASAAAMAGTFALSMAVGITCGVVGGLALRRLFWTNRRTPQGLQTLAGVLALYGVTTIAHGSGFLAVLIAGIVIDSPHVDAAETPSDARQLTEHFHATLSTLGELVAFVMLGITVNLHTLFARDVWPIGLAIFGVLAFVIRPAVCAPLLARLHLTGREISFISWAGLKGAVPLLLGALAVSGHVPNSTRLYGIVVVVVFASVVVQGTSLPFVARRLGIATEAAGSDDLSA